MCVKLKPERTKAFTIAEKAFKGARRPMLKVEKGAKVIVSREAAKDRKAVAAIEAEGQKTWR